MYTKDEIQAAMIAKGYVYFDSNSNYDVNIISVRNNAPGNKVTNIFDDIITISYKLNGVWQYHEWECTTDPGTKAVKEYHNKNGVARLVPGQYRSSHEIRKHQGKYDALCQKGLLKVYRDNNKNMIFDENKIEEGSNFGINIHHAGVDSNVVENWSEGCTVFKRIKDFNEFLAICKKAKNIHGNSFTYTLIESNDIKKKKLK